MFMERRDKSIKGCDCDKSNKLLLENIQEHLNLLHDKEITLTIDDSYRFTKHVFTRYKSANRYTLYLPETSKDDFVSQWKCYIKAISVTHVILTFIPSTLADLKPLVLNDLANVSSNDSNDTFERNSSRGSNYSDVPINVTNTLTLPIYVYDCPLAYLVSAYVNTPDEGVSSRDVYEDHRFKSADSVQDEILRLHFSFFV